MNSSAYFSAQHGDPVRSDIFEGTDQIHQPQDIKRLVITESDRHRQWEIPSEKLVGPLRIGFGGDHQNIFCLYGIGADEFDLKVDPRIYGFGDSCTIILDTQAFLDRVKAAAEALSKGCDFRKIAYFNASAHSGATGPFSKPSTFAYQKEFRIVVSPGSVSPLQLKIGDISDITTEIISSHEINTSLNSEPRKG